MKYVVFASVIALVALVLWAYMPPTPAPVGRGSSNSSRQQAFEMKVPNEVGAAWDKAWKESGEAPLFVDFSADGTNCSVRGNAMPCSDVIGYIEHSLSQSKTLPIGLTAAPGQATTRRSNLAAELKESGYLNAAVIDVTPVPKPGGSIEESK